MSTKLIGVIGFKRSGKDTTADYLCNNHNFVKYGFADPLKRACVEFFGLTEDQVYGESKDVIDPVWGCTPRDLLKVMGTEIGQYEIANHIPSFKNVGRLIWVKRFEQWYNLNRDKNVVLCDVRFEHQSDMIVKLGGEIWRVDRPGMDVGDSHASEMEFFDIPYKHLLTNDADLSAFYGKIETAFNG